MVEQCILYYWPPIFGRGLPAALTWTGQRLNNKTDSKKKFSHLFRFKPFQNKFVTSLEIIFMFAWTNTKFSRFSHPSFMNEDEVMLTFYFICFAFIP